MCDIIIGIPLILSKSTTISKRLTEYIDHAAGSEGMRNEGVDTTRDVYGLLLLVVVALVGEGLGLPATDPKFMQYL